MRWIWIDKFVEFDPGRRAVAVKNVTLAEEHLHDHFPGCPIHPPTLMIEGMAQTAGILVGETRNYDQNVVLAKIAKAEFHARVEPGDQIRFEAQVVGEVQPEGASTEGRITRDGELVAEISIMFAHLDRDRAKAETGIENFVFSGELLRVLPR